MVRTKKYRDHVNYSRSIRNRDGVVAVGAGLLSFAKKYTRDGLKSLKKTCGDDNPDTCITLGCNTNKITQYFKFETLKYAISMTPIIGNALEQNNGFMHVITYKKDTYEANAILKSAKAVDSDNLYLEAYNGYKYVNDFAKQFPTWLETYSAYEYADKIDHDIFQQTADNIDFDKGELARIFQPLYIVSKFNDKTAAYACYTGKYIAILLQYIPDAITLGEWINANINDWYSINVELVFILFQIYSVLAQLSVAQVFTHYDLHCNNVLLYKIPRDKTIWMTYTNTHWGDITFKTRYIVKIIDYGRAYFPDNPKIYQHLCAVEQCTTRNQRGKIMSNCGVARGFPFFNEYHEIRPSYINDQFIKMVSRDGQNNVQIGDLQVNDYFTNSMVLNNAHDMRLALLIWNDYTRDRKGAFGHIDVLLNNIGENYTSVSGAQHVNNITTEPDDFLMTSDKYTPPIKTVVEMYWALGNLLKTAPDINDAMQTHAGQSMGGLVINLKYTKGRIRPFTFVKRE